MGRGKLKQAIVWRKNYYKQQRLKFYWQIRQLLDLAKKEKVDKISVVVVGRNDNYGGDFSERLRTALDWNLSILPNPELIYVEWNKVQDRPSDCDWIVERYKNAKCYIVPKEIHDAITDNPKMSVMEYFGKNVGLRKASNNWILLINADILLSKEIAENIRKGLSTRYVYGTHYNNVKWDNKPITSSFLKDNSILLNSFSANKNLQSIVGNMVLAHKNSWLKGTGYDERLTDVRAGVDENGKNNLLCFGVKPMVIGNHYHLDHNESIIYGNNETHGYNKFNNLPYQNSKNWGLSNYKEVKKQNNIWQLEKI